MGKREPVVRDTKQRILDAALEVFGEHGYRGASVDDVAAAAGVTKGAIYYYFTDKDDLARDLQHRLWDQLSQEALRVYDVDRSTVDNLLVCFEAFLTTIQGMPGARVFLRDAWFSPELDEAGRNDHELALGLVQDLVQQGIDRGELEALDPEAMTRVLVGGLMEATLHILGSGELDPTVTVVRHVIRSFEASPASVRARR
jgi:AcrR family transcriptional regulator